MLFRLFAAYVRTKQRLGAAYARTQQNAQILLLYGSCPPAVWRKVRLDKGFYTHKAPDTPPGSVDDIIGVFQIVPALVSDQGMFVPNSLDSTTPI